MNPMGSTSWDYKPEIAASAVACEKNVSYVSHPYENASELFFFMLLTWHTRAVQMMTDLLRWCHVGQPCQLRALQTFCVWFTRSRDSTLLIKILCVLTRANTTYEIAFEVFFSHAPTQVAISCFNPNLWGPLDSHDLLRHLLRRLWHQPVAIHEQNLAFSEENSHFFHSDHPILTNIQISENSTFQHLTFQHPTFQYLSCHY